MGRENAHPDGWQLGGRSDDDAPKFDQAEADARAERYAERHAPSADTSTTDRQDSTR